MNKVTNDNMLIVSLKALKAMKVNIETKWYIEIIVLKKSEWVFTKYLIIEYATFLLLVW